MDHHCASLHDIPKSRAMGTECPWIVNGRVITVSPKQNGWHFTEDLFKCMFLNGDSRIWVHIYLTGAYSWKSSWQLVIICSDNGLSLNRAQATIWINVALFNWHIYGSVQKLLYSSRENVTNKALLFGKWHVIKLFVDKWSKCRQIALQQTNLSRL